MASNFKPTESPEGEIVYRRVSVPSEERAPQGPGAPRFDPTLMPLFDHLPLADMPKWRAFRDDLLTYIDTTEHTREYSLQGFEKFQRVDSELNEIIRDTSNEQDQIFQQSDALQRSSARSIKI